jgi:GTPase SAR1 family protein
MYQSMAPIYARGATGAMVVFDLTNRASFENVPKWARFVDDPLVKLVLIANKCDLEAERQVSAAEAMEPRISSSATFSAQARAPDSASRTRFSGS